MEVMWTKRPKRCSTMWGQAAAVRNAAPSRLTPTTLWYTCRSNFAMGANRARPALGTTASTRPQVEQREPFTPNDSSRERSATVFAR